MADDFGPGGIYSNIPRLDSHGRAQLPMFMRWNSDPLGNEGKNLSSVNPALQKIIARARADNPDLRFVLGSGARSAQDQDQAKAWGWSRVGSKDGGDAQVHMKGNALDLWPLDSQGHVNFNSDQQGQIAAAVRKAAQDEGVNLNWGGNWKNKDAPHFELAGAAPAAPAASPAAVAPAAAPSSSAPSGTTLNSNNVIDTLSRNIAGIESAGWKNPYDALGPTVGSRGRAIGKYQVMPENVPGWTQAALGRSMTPEEFHHDPAAQEAVFRNQMQRSLQLYGPKDAASIWFTGKPFNVAGGGANDKYTSNANYVARATAGLDGSTFTPGPAVAAASGGSGSPTSNPPPDQAAPAAPAAPGGLPGFQAGSAGEKMTQAGLKQLQGGGGGEVQPMQLQPTMGGSAVGGPMMLGAGGQNVPGRSAQLAQSQLAQLAALAQANSVQPIGTMGTTLNSMALQAGQFKSPFDSYANPDFYRSA